jgi:glycosyltransferase involved in cell wall biosynthesis
MKYRGFLLLILILCVQASAKVRLLTFHYNKSDFLELQIQSFRKFFLDDFELLVFNDASNPEYEYAIRETCEKYGIECIRYQQEWHKTDPLTKYIFDWVNNPNLLGTYCGLYKDTPFDNVAGFPSVRHCHVIQYALDHFGYDHDDIVAIIDGDVFAIKPVSLRALLSQKKLIGAYKSKNDAKYIWVPFAAADMRTLPNKRDLKFYLDVIENNLYDSGSHTHYYLLNNPNVPVGKYYFYSSTQFVPLSENKLGKQPFKQREKELIRILLNMTDVEFHIDFHFLHFVGSSWHAGESPDARYSKTQWVKELMKSVLYDE